MTLSITIILLYVSHSICENTMKICTLQFRLLILKTNLNAAVKAHTWLMHKYNITPCILVIYGVFSLVPMLVFVKRHEIIFFQEGETRVKSFSSFNTRLA